MSTRQKAFQEASDEFESLVKDAETTVNGVLAKLDEMVSCFERLSVELNLLLQVNSKIDNTHI